MMTRVEPIPASAARAEPLTGNYFVAAYPPFSTWQVEQVPEFHVALDQPPCVAPLGLYVHVPFCQKKCDYCYYLSYIGQRASTVDAYLHAVVEELGALGRRPAVGQRPVQFVYFGGGTPSTLTSAQIGGLAAGLQQALPWSGVREVTFECAPRSVRRDFLAALERIGVTRLSMGVQSLDDDLLRLNGRIHLAADVERAYAWIREIGFRWVNLDLMAGLLGETEETWRKSVEGVLRLSPESVTVYQTEIPHNTQLYRDLQAGSLPGAPVDWPTKRARLDYAFASLAAHGYTVVSAYSAVKDPVQHRFQYQDHLWRGGDMLGLGVASFGYLGGVHYQNKVTLEAYHEAIRQGTLPVRRARRLSQRDQLVREFVLQLKWGHVNVPAFKDKFGVDLRRAFAGPLRSLAAEGFLEATPEAIHLTAEGLLRVDRLLPLFYDRPFRDLRYS